MDEEDRYIVFSNSRGRSVGNIFQVSVLFARVDIRFVTGREGEGERIVRM